MRKRELQRRGLEGKGREEESGGYVNCNFSEREMLLFLIFLPFCPSLLSFFF